MQTNDLLKMIEHVVDERKGQNITTINVTGKTSVTDYMVIATSTSERHGKALANYVLEKAKENNITPLGIEGQQGSDWVLLDLDVVILHIFTAQAREFYELEKLWSVEREEDQQQTS